MIGVRKISFIGELAIGTEVGDKSCPWNSCEGDLIEISIFASFLERVDTGLDRDSKIDKTSVGRILSDGSLSSISAEKRGEWLVRDSCTKRGERR